MKSEAQLYAEGAECQIIRLPDVIRQVKLGRSSLYSYIKLGTFPAPIKIGSRASGWLAHEVNAWVAERVAASRTKGVTQ
jgi:prophage regulatory protein